MEESVTDLIKKQYSNYPYPPIPIGCLEEEVLYSTNYEFVNYLCTGVFKSHQKIKILDVGCGTGYSTLKLAQQNPDALITAIDLTPASVSIAKKRLKKAGVLSERVSFITGDLMKLKDIGDRFDYIVCTGVLHHLESPEKGLDFLKNHLKKQGIIYLMLYSEYGRFYQNLTRNIINLLQNNKSDFSEGIKIGKEFFKTLNDSHPIKSRFNRSYEASLNVINKEFADSDSQFVDAYINANERTYNIEELFNFIESKNLHFIRFQDEFKWDLNYLLKGNKYLLSKVSKLSKIEKYKLGEIIDSEKNFAFFVSKSKFTKIVLNDKELLFYKIKFTTIYTINKNNAVNIISPLGLTINLNENSSILYNFINEELTISEILDLAKKTINYPLNKVKKDFLLLIRKLELNGIIMFNK